MWGVARAVLKVGVRESPRVHDITIQYAPSHLPSCLYTIHVLARSALTLEPFESLVRTLGTHRKSSFMV